MSAVVEQAVEALRQIFARHKDKRTAHAESRTVLEQLSRDPAFLRGILARYLSVPANYDRGHYPVIALPIAINPDFELVANCWIPLPNRDVTLSTKAIHHHGNMLLSTVTVFGPGYEHWLFSAPRLVDAERELYQFDVIEAAPHPAHHVAFVDDHLAHVPLYPVDLSITVALWSNQFPTTWKDRVKRIELLKRHERLLKRSAKSMGLAEALDLKILEYFDFYPTEGGFRGMKTREEFRLGPTQDHLQSLFHIMQRTGNGELADIAARHTSAVGHSALLAQLIADLRAGRPIEGKLSPGHYDVSFANFHRQQIERSLKETHGSQLPATSRA